MKTVDRFTAKLELGDFQPQLGSACWLWTGSICSRGYGRFYPPAYPSNLAHRWSYEYHVAPIAAGLELDHRCRNRNCVNPWHVEPVTHDENMLRAHKTHCKRGHALEGANLRERLRAGKIVRHCRACDSLHEAKRRGI